MPDKDENYVHRVGRTGRGNQKGYAVSYCSEEEKELLADIEAYLGDAIEVITIAHDEYVDTLAFSQQSSTDWKTLMRDAEREENDFKKKKKPAKKKKKKYDLARTL